MKNHILKTWPEYFQAVIEGRKTFELLKAKGTWEEWGKYQVGDRIMFREFDPIPVKDNYTGRFVVVRITYVFTPEGGVEFGLDKNWVILGIEDWNKGGSIGPQVIPGHEPNRRARVQEIVVRWVGPSSNQLFGRSHWTDRRAWNMTAQVETWVACRAQKIQPVTYRVDLEFFPYMAGSDPLRDTSNNSLTAKMIEDGLVKAGILVDDSTKWVRKIINNPPQRSPAEQPWSFMKIKILEVLCEKKN